MPGKLLKEVNIRMDEEMHHFLAVRAKQAGCDGIGEYIRILIRSDMERAAHDYSLLAEALKLSSNNVKQG